MTYEEMFELWTARLKAMSDDERDALHHAVDDYFAPPLPTHAFGKPIEWKSFNVQDVFVEIVTPEAPLELKAIGPSDYSIKSITPYVEIVPPKD